MSTTLSLLALPQAQAHANIVASALIDGVDVTRLQIGDPYVRQDGRVGLLISVPEETLEDPNWKYQGTVDYSIRRMPLEEFFAGIQLKVRIPKNAQGGLTTSSHEVVAALSQAFNIVFAPGDYYSDAIVSDGTARYTLRAAPLSTRWTGAVDIIVFPTE
jgi:hypothetical protein